MPKRRLLFLILSLVLAFTILSGQIADTAYADNGNNGKKQTEDYKKDNSLEKYLKPLMNVKVQNGEVIFKNGLINKGWKNKGTITELYYIIKVFSYSQNKYVFKKRFDVSIRNAGKAITLKPGRIKNIEDYLDLSDNVWELSAIRRQMTQAGKYKAEIHWYAKVNGKWHTASVSKVFTLHKKDIKGWEPWPTQQPVPQRKPKVYVKLNAEKQDGKLNIDIALVNTSDDNVRFDFGSLKQYDIIISDRYGNAVYDTRDWMSAQMINHIDVDPDDAYYFPKDEWHFTDANGKRVPAGKYTVKVVLNPANKESLTRKYDLSLEDSITVEVTEKDIRYDMDAILSAEVIDRNLILDLSMRNRTSQDVTVQFRSGQRYKIKIYDKSGKKVYDYQTDSIQAIIPETLKANSTLKYVHSISLPELGLAAGEYTVQAEFNVYNILDRNGNVIKEDLYNIAASKMIELTDLDVNRYVAVAVEPAVEKTPSGDRLTIPVALYNVLEEAIRLKLNRPNYRIRILDSNSNVLFAREETVNWNTSILLSRDDSLSFGLVSWNMRDKSQKRIHGDVTIEVTINADMLNIDDKYNTELKTAQKFQIPK